MNDPYEIRRPWKYWAAQQEAVLDVLGFDWAWFEAWDKEWERRKKKNDGKTT